MITEKQELKEVLPPTQEQTDESKGGEKQELREILTLESSEERKIDE